MKKPILKSVDNFENELGGEIIQKFLKNFKREVKDFYARVGENPLHYREKKLTSIIFPALYKISPNIILEHEFGQKLKEGNVRKSSRYLDAWFLDKSKENLFLIEFKHGWDYLSSNKIDSNSNKRWEGLKKQLDDIKLKEVNEYLGVDKKVNIYSLGLYFMPTFNGYNDQDKFNIETYLEENKFKIFNKNEFSWIWEISNELNEYISEDYWNIRYYNIFGKIKKLRSV